MNKLSGPLWGAIIIFILCLLLLLPGMGWNEALPGAAIVTIGFVVVVYVGDFLLKLIGRG